MSLNWNEDKINYVVKSIYCHMAAFTNTTELFFYIGITYSMWIFVDHQTSKSCCLKYTNNKYNDRITTMTIINLLQQQTSSHCIQIKDVIYWVNKIDYLYHTEYKQMWSTNVIGVIFGTSGYIAPFPHYGSDRN